MKKIGLYFLSLVTLWSISSCSVSDQNIKPGFTGASGELLIVCPDEWWNAELGDSLRSWLQPYYPMLPQAEAMFSLVQYKEDEVNDLLKKHRNILHISPKKQGEAAGFKLLKSQYSKDQMYYHLLCSNSSEALEILEERYGSLISQVRKEERKRITARYSKYRWDGADEILQKNFDLKMTIPQGFEVTVEKDSFVRLKRERQKKLGGTTHYISDNIVVYQYPYTQDSAFAQPYLLQARNTILGANVPGPVDSSFMSTQTFFEPTVEELNFNGKYATELRGLWRTTRSFLGGPFVSLSMISPNGENVITVEGFLLAPKFDKREFMKELEAIVYSARFVAKEPTS